MGIRNAKLTTLLRSLLRRWFGRSTSTEKTATPVVEAATTSKDDLEDHIIHSITDTHPSPYDPELYGRTRTQWQFGDWESITKIDIHTLEHHPERAKLALIVASAWQQLNDQPAAYRFIQLAKEWGCSKKLMAQLLVAGVYNTLGCSAAISGNKSQAQAYFRLAVKGGGGNERLASHIRFTREIDKLQFWKRFQNHAANGQLSQQLPTHVNSDADTNTMDEPPANPFRPGIVSYAQNFEDVMLWRALGHIENGFYIDIGAQDPIIDSVSKAFYEHGWRGIHVEATPAYAEALRKDRPDEIVIEAAVTDQNGQMTFYEIPETGMSTGDSAIAQSHQQKGYPIHEITVSCMTLTDVFAKVGGHDIHWLKIDVEGMESHALAGWGEAEVLPWIVVVESTLPNTQIETHEQWEYLLRARGYRPVYFDGLSRFYVSEYHKELANAFRSGPNVFDNFALSGNGGSYCSLINTKLKQKEQEITELKQTLAEQQAKSNHIRE